MQKPEQVKFLFNMPVKLKEKIAAAAAAKMITQADVIRLALQQYLKKN